MAEAPEARDDLVGDVHDVMRATDLLRAQVIALRGYDDPAG